MMKSIKPGDVIQNRHGWQGRVEKVEENERFGAQVLVEYASTRQWENQGSLYVVVSVGRKE